MSQIEDEDLLVKNSFEFEDRISNVITTPKNKDRAKSSNKLKNVDRENKSKVQSSNNNSKNVQNLEENKFLNKMPKTNFFNGDIEIFNAMKNQLKTSENQVSNETDQQKLFETFLMFQKFMSTQTANNTNNQNSNNSNKNDNRNDVYVKDNNINNIPSDYIHQRKKNNGTLSSSNIPKEIKSSNLNNFNTINISNPKENNIYENKDSNTIEGDMNTKQINKNPINNSNFMKNLNNELIDDNLSSSNNNVTNIRGFNKLKNRNKPSSFEKNSEKDQIENEIRNSIKENTKASIRSKNDLNKISSFENNNKFNVESPDRDIEFSNRSSFDVKKENLPMNYDSSSALKVDKFINNYTNTNIIANINNINFENPKVSDNKFQQDNNNNENENNILKKRLEFNNNITKNLPDNLVNKNNNNLQKKIKEEDFFPKNHSVINSDLKIEKNNKNMSNNNNNLKNKQIENPSNVTNFDETPIIPSKGNFLELFEKNLAAEQGNLYNSNINELEKSESKKAVKPRRNQRYKREINVSMPSKETKKYKYYSDNFDKKPSLDGDDNSNEHKSENFNQRISFGSNNTNSNPFMGNPNGKVFGKNKSVEKFNNNKNLDKARNPTEEKNNNFNLNGNLTMSSQFPKGNSKPKVSSFSRKNSKKNPLRYILISIFFKSSF